MTLRQLTMGLALLVSIAACGGDSVFVPDITKTQFATSLQVDLAASTKTASGLYYRDLTVGTGALNPTDTAKTVTVGYTGYRNGVQFDAGTIGPFRTGTGAVIAGFDEGLKGMRAGGRRQLIIPPSLGYGAQSTNGIPANSILVFVVDLRLVIN
ncbi:MAG: FKBP-type peptidyl-prolyl cis-trans isomerase, partial [Gemmatimonadota bacterium]